MTFVSVDMETGTLRRYECGGEAFRFTHQATPLDGSVPSPGQVESFRVDPPDDFKIEPPPRPTNPPAAAGQITMAA